MSMDGSGLEEDAAKEIGTNYFLGCCLRSVNGASGLPGSTAEINTNAVFDAARRMSLTTRIISRRQFVGYEVRRRKSILWFKRRSIYSSDVDLFDGLVDAIVNQAPARGWTNEWLCGVWLKPYHPSDSSIWKPEAFSDFYSIFDRCGFAAPEIGSPSNPEVAWHVAYGQLINSTVGNPLAEMPPGWRYMRLPASYGGSDFLNQKSCGGDPVCEANRLAFFKSCRIYEPDLEVESCQAVTENGEELVSITLSGRLHNTAGETGGAPESIGRDISAWVAADIQAEPFRTLENALRLYLINQADGTNSTAIVGDQALNSWVQVALSDNPYAAIYPHFVFTKLIPLPHDDGNDVADDADSALWHDVFPQMEMCLRAMAEGFVDETSTLERNECVESSETCADNGHDLFDYTFEALCLQAFGGRWLTTLPSIATSRIAAEDCRPDQPQGFGPLPKTVVSGEVFNQFAAAIDLLDKVRLMLPYALEKRERLYSDSVEYGSASGSAACGNDNCGAAGKFAMHGVGPPARSLISDSGWVDASGGGEISGSTGAAFETGCGTDPSKFVLTTDRWVLDYRFTLQEADAQYAIPEAWRDMVDANVGTLFCVKEVTKIRKKVDEASGTSCGIVTFGCTFDTVCNTQDCLGTYRCAFLKAGTVDFGATAPSSWFYVSVNTNPLDVCTYGCVEAMYLTALPGRCVYLQVPLEDTDDQEGSE